jgi:ABC-type dipeptide/oligopeptide/nickel transport system permease component
MNARAETMQRTAGRRFAERIAAAFVLLVLAAATLVFWIGIPVGLLWGFSKVTDSWNRHFLLSLVLIPIAMALYSPLLFWLNGLYLRITGALAQEDEENARSRLRGPLELFLYAGMAVALVALFAWFFLLANNPPEVVW